MRSRRILLALAICSLLAVTFVWNPSLQRTASGAGTPPDFGDGSDGAKVYSSSTTDAPIDAPASGTAGSTTLTASNASFAAGQKILVHQTRGTGAGEWEINEIQSYAPGSIVTTSSLANTYTISGAEAAQVLVVPQHTNVTVNAGVTVSAKSWSGSTGGIFAVLVSGTAAVNGQISADGRGYAAQPNGSAMDEGGKAGEGTAGPAVVQVSANGNGGGGSAGGGDTAGGGGGGHGTSGETGGTGTIDPPEVPGSGGNVAGSADLSSMVLGGAGGNAGNNGQTQEQKKGGTGGGIVMVVANRTTLGPAGSITADGANGDGAQTSNQGGHGGGAGGSILIRTDTASFGTGTFTAIGGLGGSPIDFAGAGGAGGDGRIRVEYCNTSSGGTFDPLASERFIVCGSGSEPVGGIAELPEVAGTPLEAPESSGPNAGVLPGVAAVAAGTIALGGAAWYVRRKRLR